MSRWWICCLLAVNLASGVRSIDNCGTRKALERELEYNAKQASPGEWPWHAGIFYWINTTYFKYGCGGSIIARNYVLTAGHCTYSDKDSHHGTSYKRLRSPNWSDFRPAKSLLVQVGLTNLQKLDHSLQRHSVAEIIRHARSMPNDIALLKLTKELQITDYVRPICLWSESESQNKTLKKEAYIAGWRLDENHELPNELEHVVMPTSDVARSVCQLDAFSNGDESSAGTFCVNFSNDSALGIGWIGGGVYIEVDGHWVLRGIIIQVQRVLTDFNRQSGTWSGNRVTVNFSDVGRFNFEKTVLQALRWFSAAFN